MKSLVISAGLVFFSLNVAAQLEEINGGPVNVPAEGIVDGVYIQEHIPTKRMIPYEYVREADVIWSRRVWEYIDLREKINLPMYYPLDDFLPTGEWVRNGSRWSLWTVLRHHVLNGNLRLFAPFNPITYGLASWDGDQLKYPIDPSQPGLNFYTDSLFHDELFYYFGNVLKDPNAQALVDEYGDPILETLADGTTAYKYPPGDTVWFKSEDIVQYRIKEDWFFDKERSVLDVRIIAIAPVVYKVEVDPNGKKSISGMKELFWLYFPHCRFVLNNYFVYNDANDAQWMSFDDLFWKRRFSSMMYKESNTYDRNIESYRTGTDALRESDKIKEEIRTIEHDVWSF